MPKKTITWSKFLELLNSDIVSVDGDSSAIVSANGDNSSVSICSHLEEGLDHTAEFLSESNSSIEVLNDNHAVLIAEQGDDDESEPYMFSFFTATPIKLI